MTNAEISFGDTPLGLDDFPTEIIVTTTLKHCKPRDMTEIGRMFTKGESGLALPLGQGGWTNYYSNEKTPDNVLTKSNYNEYTWQQYFGSRHSKGISINMAEQTNG